MKLAIFGLLAYAAFQLIGCGQPLDPEVQMDELMDQRWLLENVGGTASYDLDTLRPNHISFTSDMPNTAMAFAGCNSVAGRYQLDGMSLVFDRVVISSDKCEDQTQELLLKEALEKTNNYRIVKDKLELYNDREKLAVFVKDTGEYFLPVPYDVQRK